MTWLQCFALFVVATLVYTNPISPTNQNSPTETIQSGQIMGKRIDVLDKQVDAFLGIPFAEPISGDRRFKLPVAKAPWSGVFNATEYGHGCWQVLDTAFPGFEGTEIWNPTVPLSDDCLNLNVWVPFPRPQNSAVLVWIFGGGFWYGGSSLSLYDGKFLAAHEDMIIVSMNYRVGAFGFLATGDSSAPGNQGLYDQVMALQWVQDNIVTFGGDPNQVTIFGESAGGVSVGLHMLSPVSQPLFQRAGIQSAGPTTPWGYIDRDTGLKRAKLLAESLGCLKSENGEEHSIPDMVQCLQNVDVNELLGASWVTSNVLEFPFTPVYDGIFLPEDPATALENGNFKDCELIIGSNTNEANFFLIYEAPGFNKDTESLLDNEGYITALEYAFPNANSLQLDAIASQYRPKIPDDGSLLRDAVDHAVGDYMFSCPSVDFAQAYAKAGNQVYYYRFEERASSSPFPDWMGVLHGDEIVYIFGVTLAPSFGYSSREQAMSKRMMEFWANFARTGNPNSASSSNEWPEFTDDAEEYLVLEEALVDGPGTTGNRVKPQCDFWWNELPKLGDHSHHTDNQMKSRKHPESA
ncbi:acetylcholinesterase-like [Amphiura filiformis]|uniref:acetylcholinesterase-like n=1 Tax=Amphiura filiformis TaxID=82378 RepID=UPI003B222ED5